MTGVHHRYVQWFDFAANPAECPERQVSLKMFSPGVSYFLVRTRLWVEFRVEAYSLTDSQQPDLEWFADMWPVVGVEYFTGSADPVASDDPIGSLESGNWVIWDGLRGENEQVVLSPHGFNTWSRAWRSIPSTMDSFARRSPGTNAAQSLWLAWNWMDPANLINRSHESFDLVFDLQVNVACDSFWKLRPT